MLFFVGNTTKNYTICYPILILHNFKVLEFPWTLLLSIEIVLHVVAACYVFKCIYITVSIRTFHKNMTALVVGFACQWFESILANAMSWPYETGFWTLRGLDPSLSGDAIKQWWTDDESQMIHVVSYQEDIYFFIAGFIKIHYLISMSTVLMIISVERSFACYFLSDYEQKSRIWIAVLIISLNQAFNLIATIFLYFKTFHFIWMVLINFIPNALGIGLLLSAQHFNLKVTETIENFANPNHYTLAARFQAKENIRCFQMIRTVVLAGLLLIAFGFTIAFILFYDLFPQLDTLLNAMIQGAMSLGPLVICPTMIYSVESWRKFDLTDNILICKRAKERIGRRSAEIMPMRKGSVMKNELIRKDTDTYFNQLTASWT
ncbi:unnamed protein product [Caenorhabditis sp. 36 PRJEB53466]|nr:unnamed protein product [Caenorhabditis sp. 36 PRJEB53466]